LSVSQQNPNALGKAWLAGHSTITTGTELHDKTKSQNTLRIAKNVIVELKSLLLGMALVTE